MIIYYNNGYNIDLGLLNIVHPFDGLKYRKVEKNIKNLPDIQIVSPTAPISNEIINKFADSLMRLLLYKKRYILKALEVPYIPLLPFSFVDRKILSPMRWAVSGTLEAAIKALDGNTCWNLSGGYHHASRASAEGFCVYNDIGIAVMELREKGLLTNTDKILIIDIDAHHGNGNAFTFLEDENVTIFDIYNNDIYPNSILSKNRVNINIPLKINTMGIEYLDKLETGLNSLTSDYKIAFIIAGTDVIKSDPLGGLSLTVDECVKRDQFVINKLNQLSIPSIILGGGGYSKESSEIMISSITNLYK